MIVSPRCPGRLSGPLAEFILPLGLGRNSWDTSSLSVFDTARCRLLNVT